MHTGLIAVTTLLVLSAVGGLRIELCFAPEPLLPGTSASMRVAIVNDGSAAVELRNAIRLEVISPDGDRFFASRTRTSVDSAYRDIPPEFFGKTASDEPEAFVIVPAQSKFVFSVPFFHRSTFFNDERLSQPRHYEVRLGMHARDGDPVWSAEVPLEVVNPSGVNATVWTRMNELTDGRGWGWEDWDLFDFDTVVLSEFAESDYAPYAAGYASLAGPLRDLGLKGPFRDYILLHEADRKAASLATAISNRDRSNAIRVARELRALFDDLLAGTDDEYIKVEVRRLLADEATPERIDESIRELELRESTSSRKVIPKVHCVSPAGDRAWMAWFGYESEFGYDFSLPLSTGRNKFEPKPNERGQTTVFKPGGEARAFSVVFDGEPLTWFVRGEKATASKDFPTRCTE